MPSSPHLPGSCKQQMMLLTDHKRYQKVPPSVEVIIQESMMRAIEEIVDSRAVTAMRGRMLWL